MAEKPTMESCAFDSQDALQAAKEAAAELSRCIAQFHRLDLDLKQSQMVLAARTTSRKLQLCLDEGHEDLAHFLEAVDAEVAGAVTRRR